MMVTLLLAAMIPATILAATERPFIRVGVYTNKPPYSFLHWSEKGPMFRGAQIDIIQQIFHYADIPFRYVKCLTPPETYQALQSKRIDMIGHTIIREDNRYPGDYKHIPTGLELTSWLFIHKSCSTVVCTQDLKDKRIAMIGSSKESHPLLKGIGENIEIFPFSSPLEALRTLEEGFVDAYLAPSEKIAAYIIRKEEFENIRRVGIALDKIPLAIAVPDADPKLYQKLVHAAEQVRMSGMIRRIESKWFGKDYSPSFLEKHRRSIYFSIALIVLAFGAAMIWVQYLKKQVGRFKGQFKVSQERYSNLIESSPDMIFVVTKEGEVTHMNREARHAMPFIAKDSDGTPPILENLVAQADRSKFKVFLNEVFNQKKAMGEFQFKDLISGYLEIDIAGTLLPDEPGAEAMACLFARDVTEKKRIERDLVQADKMAIIGQMAADVAHEINNPIGIVTTNIELILARGWHDEEATEFLEACKRNTLRAGKYTRDLLAVARPKTPQMEKLDLWELVSTTIDLLGAQLKDIEIEKQTKGRPALIRGDRNLIQQVLVNLMLNSAAAMKESDDPSMTITCCVPDGTEMVRLRIEDIGVGIPKANLTQVFEPFFTEGKKEGFGLGLFICRRIIENHNGEIYAESELNKGSLFVVELPLIENTY